MREMFWLFEILATFLESLTALLVVTISSSEKYSGKRSAGYHFLFSAVLTGMITALNTITLFSYLTPLLAIAFIIFVSSRILSSGPLSIRATACFLAYTVIQTIDYIIVVILGLAWNISDHLLEVFASAGPERLTLIAIAKTVQILAFLLLRRQLPKLQSLSRKMRLAAFLLSVISYAYMQFLFNSILSAQRSLVQTMVILSWVFILLFILAMLAFFIALTRIEHDEQTRAMLASENALMADNYRKLHEQQQDNAKNLHDFKHHLIVIDGLLSDAKIQEASRYIGSLLEHSFPANAACHSGNDIIDAIINCKSAEAAGSQIQFEYMANLRDGVNIEPIDLCGVLANQIDNAFDACRKIPNERLRKVSVEVKQVQDFVFLKVVNTVNENPFDSSHELKSTKAGPLVPHGFGLKSIQEIAERYNGAVRNEFQDGVFISTVSLCQRPFDTTNYTI